MIDASERRKLLAVPLCGDRVVARLEALGVVALGDLRGRDPYTVMDEVNERAGRAIWRPPLAVAALTNLIEAAALER